MLTPRALPSSHPIPAVRASDMGWFLQKPGAADTSKIGSLPLLCVKGSEPVAPASSDLPSLGSESGPLGRTYCTSPPLFKKSFLSGCGRSWLLCRLFSSCRVQGPPSPCRVWLLLLSTGSRALGLQSLRFPGSRAQAQ